MEQPLTDQSDNDSNMVGRQLSHLMLQSATKQTKNSHHMARDAVKLMRVLSQGLTDVALDLLCTSLAICSSCRSCSWVIGCSFKRVVRLMSRTV